MAQINSEIKSIKINGTKVGIVDGSFNWVLGGKTREAVLGSNQLLGFTEANAAGECTFDVAYTKGLDIKGTFDVVDAQVAIEWDRGDTWLMTGASLTAVPTGAAPGGVLSLEYMGNAWLIG